MRVSEAFLRMVDDWRRRQKDLPSRAEAIRRLVESATKQRTTPERDSWRSRAGEPIRRFWLLRVWSMVEQNSSHSPAFGNRGDQPPTSLSAYILASSSADRRRLSGRWQRP